jgi:hypothetical protein
MPTNPYFNHVTFRPTQDLIEDLNIEAIKLKGLNVFYLPRTVISDLDMFGENPSNYYADAIMVEMYLETPLGFEGQGEVVTRFGLELMHNISLTISKRRFREEMAKSKEYVDHPKEGDLVFIKLEEDIAPMLFEIKYVDERAGFFQQGKIYNFRMECEKVKYSYEKIITGNSEIDQLQVDLIQNLDINGDGQNDTITQKKDQDDNNKIQQDADDIINFNESNPFSEGNI